MSDIRLTCDETPLAWPTTVTPEDLTKCGSCGFRLLTAQPGSLQVLTRRQGGGAGDGVNIEEDSGLGIDYRGQRYTYEESVLHVPGLHVFPGQKEAYPAEYHLHFKTFSAPQRAITVVVPVSHKEKGPGEKYFAAVAAKPDPNAKRPMVDTLFVPGSKVIQYRGPDIRGRTKDKPQTAACSAEEERQFLLVLTVAQIRATDLERIPREGSLSTDPRDLPAPGVKAKTSLPRDRMLRCAVLAEPGILGAPAKELAEKTTGVKTQELECNPVKVVGGKDVVMVGKKPVPLTTLLGLESDKREPTPAPGPEVKAELTPVQRFIEGSVAMIATFFGLFAADALVQNIWDSRFKPSGTLTGMSTIKKIIFAMIILSAGGAAAGSRNFFHELIKSFSE